MFKKAAIAATLVAGAAALLPLQSALADGTAPGMYATAESQGMFERSGWYLGADLGGAFNPGVATWNCGNCSAAVNNANLALQNKANSSVVTGGLYGGYQYKWEAPVVTGVEIDFNGLGNLRKNDSASCTAPATQGFCSLPGLTAGQYTATTNRNTNFFGTVRGHMGYIPAPNQEIYFSGGFAYAGNSGAGQATLTGPNASAVVRSGGSTTKTGSVFGGGYSYAFNSNMAVRLEAMYINLKSNDHNFTIPVSGVNYTYDESVKFHFTVVRVGFTYKFDL